MLFCARVLGKDRNEKTRYARRRYRFRGAASPRRSQRRAWRLRPRPTLAARRPVWLRVSPRRFAAGLRAPPRLLRGRGTASAERLLDVRPRGRAVPRSGPMTLMQAPDGGRREIGKIPRQRISFMPLLPARSHCFRMAAACTSSYSIICSSRFCGVRRILLVTSSIRLGSRSAMRTRLTAPVAGIREQRRRGVLWRCWRMARIAGRRPNQMTSTVTTMNAKALMRLPELPHDLLADAHRRHRLELVGRLPETARP